MIVNNENEIRLPEYQNFNQKFLTNDGVCAVFMNAFGEVAEGKLPTIRPKLRKILVDFSLRKTYVELNPILGIVQVFFRDCLAEELRRFLLQKFNQSKTDQSVELNIRMDVCPAPKKADGQVKTYSGLTRFLFQEFIQQAEPRNLIDDDPYNQMKEIIKQGNISPSVPLESIFKGELG